MDILQGSFSPGLADQMQTVDFEKAKRVHNPLELCCLIEDYSKFGVSVIASIHAELF